MNSVFDDCEIKQAVVQSKQRQSKVVQKTDLGVRIPGATDSTVCRKYVINCGRADIN